MDITSTSQMDRYVKSLKYLVVFPDKTTKFYKSLRKIAEDDFGSLGDTSTLAEPAVVNDLIENRENRND